MKVLKAILYVQSVKTEIGVDDRSHEGYVVQTMGGAGGSYSPPPRIFRDYKVYREKIYKNILPEDQKALVEMVNGVALQYGFELTVIDVAKSSLHKVENRLKGMSTYPALVTDSGLKIEGDITEERIKAFFTSARTRSRTTVR